MAIALSALTGLEDMRLVFSLADTSSDSEDPPPVPLMCSLLPALKRLGSSMFLNQSCQNSGFPSPT